MSNRRAAVEVISQLQQHGFEALLAGGCVRGAGPARRGAALAAEGRGRAAPHVLRAHVFSIAADAVGRPRPDDEAERSGRGQSAQRAAEIEPVQAATQKQRQQHEAGDAEAQRRDVPGVERGARHRELRDRRKAGPDQRRERAVGRARDCGRRRGIRDQRFQ